MEEAFKVIEDGDGWCRIVTGHSGYVWSPDRHTPLNHVRNVCEAMNDAFQIGRQSGIQETQKTVRRVLGISRQSKLGIVCRPPWPQ